MKIAELNENLEKCFWRYLNKDPLDHYFFIHNYRRNREITKFFLVVGKGSEILGLLMNYNNQIVHLRGTEEAFNYMLGEFCLEKTRLRVPIEYEQMVLEKYPSFSFKVKIDLMALKKGRESIKIVIEPQKLVIEDSKEISELLKQTKVESWNKMSIDEVKSRFGEYLWFGIRQGGELVSVGAVCLADYGSLISTVATREPYRNKGFATTTVSALVREAFKVPSTPLLTVPSDNLKAIQLYSTVGFNLYKSYIFFRP